jgi:hypothetical protein
MASLYGLAAVRRSILGGDTTDDNDDKPSKVERPAIRVRAGFLHEIATEGETALIKAGAPFYVRGELMMFPVIDDETAANGLTTKVARLREVATNNMIDHLSRAAKFEKWDRRSKKSVPVNPPHEVAQTILARVGEWRLPKIIGVITTPTIRPDGTILDTPGYDPVTRLLLVEPPEMPIIPEYPTRDRAGAPQQPGRRIPVCG